jgi:hypothetical protein
MLSGFEIATDFRGYRSIKPKSISPTGDSQGVLSEKDVVNFPCEEIATRLSGSLFLK